MVLKLPSAGVKALPITLQEFSESLYSAWGQASQRTRHPTTFGLAVSGGVDSIALASLCAEVQALRSTNLKFRAFVVDHGAREGSHEEAKAVAELVKNKGINTRVLKIEWPKDLIPSESPNFESLARRYRFRILGEACRDSNVRGLLLAHHEDDYYETILMRLARGHKGPGLLGMRPNARIPECYGIYGVYDSGATKMAESRGRRLVRAPLGRMQLEDGGIRILRPLLQFSKERLIATCLQDGALWFEDHTNADPTLTPRNAIRHICKQHSLPAALQKDAIIALSTSLQEKTDSLEREALAMLHHTIVGDFQPRAGSMFVRFPKLISAESEPINGTEQKDAKLHQWVVASRILKYAIQAVSPDEHVQYELENACSTVFPELNAANDQGKIPPTTFTVAGVIFSRNERSFQPGANDAASEGGRYQGARQHREIVPMQEYEWFLSRQPHFSTLKKQPTLEYPPFKTLKDYKDGWKLYDGRYWIRIFNHSSATIKVRPLEASDFSAFRKFGFKTAEAFRYRIKLAPREVRFTLPVIVMAAERPNEEDKVLALPTLDVAVFDAEYFLVYEIRYKKVEWPLLQSGLQGPNMSGERLVLFSPITTSWHGGSRIYSYGNRTTS